VIGVFVLETLGLQFVRTLREIFIEETTSRNWLTKGYYVFISIMAFVVVYLVSNPQTELPIVTAILSVLCIIGLFMPFIPGADTDSKRPTNAHIWQQFSLLFGAEIATLYGLCFAIGLPSWKGFMIPVGLCVAILVLYGIHGHYRHFPWLFCATISCVITSVLLRAGTLSLSALFPDWELAMVITLAFLFEKEMSHDNKTNWRKAIEWTLWLTLPQVFFIVFVHQSPTVARQLGNSYLWNASFWSGLQQTGIVWTAGCVFFVPILWALLKKIWENPTVALEDIPYPIIGIFGGSLLAITTITRLLGEPRVFWVFSGSVITQFAVIWLITLIFIKRKKV